MHTLIAGTGAVGGFLGWRLIKAGWPVTLLARGATADAIEARGLRVRSDDREDAVRAPVVRDLGAPPEDGFDLVIAAVKMPDLPALAAALHDALGAEGTVVAVQNGLGAEEVLAARLGAARVVGGVAYVGVDCPEPGLVRHVTGGRLTLSTLPGIDMVRAARLSLLFEAAGIPCRLADDLRALRWSKLVWNASFSPVTAIAGVTLGEAVDDPRLLGVVRAAMEEVAAVARAAGVRLRDDVVERNLDLRPDFRAALTSMLQDVRRGRPTEIEAILGEVLRHAAARGVPVPTLQTLYSQCAALDRPRPA
ncbi:MAG: 2-dehydropantoate 2-reductase [Deltaproteobacteria bacterium]|nr:2-dehydropantoate 2-reductase [Deltaproteobacteria bacterium]